MKKTMKPKNPLRRMGWWGFISSATGWLSAKALRNLGIFFSPLFKATTTLAPIALVGWGALKLWAPQLLPVIYGALPTFGLPVLAVVVGVLWIIFRIRRRHKNKSGIVASDIYPSRVSVERAGCWGFAGAASALITVVLIVGGVAMATGSGYLIFIGVISLLGLLFNIIGLVTLDAIIK